MFVEHYRQENSESIMAGGARAIPYPKIAEEDWRVWRMFVPHRTQSFDGAAALRLSPQSLQISHNLPYSVATEVKRAAEYFDKIEVWRKREVTKDPIAVGVLGAERYLIARWGMEKLLPFDRIKKRMALVLAWKYGTSAALALASLVGMGYLVAGLF
jgi:hypothetical protein